MKLSLAILLLGLGLSFVSVAQGVEVHDITLSFSKMVEIQPPTSGYGYVCYYESARSLISFPVIQSAFFYDAQNGVWQSMNVSDIEIRGIGSYAIIPRLRKTQPTNKCPLNEYRIKIVLAN